MLANEELEEDGVTPKVNKLYKEHRYWEHRFSKEEHYEWLVDYRQIRDQLMSVLLPSDRVLLVGNGNSNLALDLVRDGYKNIVASDYSAIVVNEMRQRQPEVKDWVVADMLQLSRVFEVESFDCIIDKAAMDALVTDSGDPWNPNKDTCLAISSLTREAATCLRDDGKLIQISFQQPHFRKRLIGPDSPYLDLVSVSSIDSGLGYFFYIFKKKKKRVETEK